jgi:hypothetical protein
MAGQSVKIERMAQFGSRKGPVFRRQLLVKGEKSVNKIAKFRMKG